MSRPALLACVVAALGVATAACGPKVPQHSGYKSKKSKPWSKPAVIALKAGAGEVEGKLEYATFRRAKWLAIDLPADGELTLTLEQSPDVDHKVDIALEVLDEGYAVIAKADREDEDAFEEEKTRTLYELHGGRYLVHLYLQGRLDVADYELKAKFAPKAIASSTSEVGMSVPLPPNLPVVPLDDDTPAQTRPRRGGGSRPTVERQPAETKPPAGEGTLTGPVKGRVINVAVVDGGVEITINRGVDHGLADGVKGRIDTVKNSEFVLKGCGNRSCRAVVRATPDQVGGQGVTIGP